MVWTATLSSKGQLVLPKAIRDELGVKPGDKILFVTRRGRVELRAYSSDIMRWYGALAVDTPQDWGAVQGEAGHRRAEEVARESEGH